MTGGKKRMNIQRASVAPARLSLEEELNDLRSLSAMQAAKLKSLEAQLSDRGETQDPGEAARAEILGLLATAKDGKPGSLTVARLTELCKDEATKSKIHTHLNVLEKKGKVWLRKTHDPKNGRPCTMAYHHAAIREA